ncbi:DUF4383 domain-containing protein [Hamadaea sp. NPDC050747]|uniref:DUF4383 domain-containing protein n=1 Tax=Hamadaea sp. NPDC050747 TaxID=3155789 RepID=UPI0033F9292A
MQRKQTLLFGVVMAIVTTLNFIPGTSVVRDGTKLLFGIFQVGPGLEVLHYAMAAALILFGLLARSTRGVLVTTGTIFGLAAIIGWISGDHVFGLMDVNVADNALHTFFALFLFTLAFALRDAPRVPVAVRG